MSRAMRDQSPSKPHLVRGSGGIAGEISDLRGDVDGAFDALENRPVLTRLTGGSTALSLAGLPTAKAMVGVGLLGGRAKATLTFGTGTAQLDFNANRPGTPGNAITVAIVDSAGGGLAVSVVGTDIEIDKGGGVDDADAIKAALDGDADILNLIATTSGGVGVPVVTAQANLAGGTGDGFDVYVNGIVQKVNGPITDTAIPMLVDDLTGAANLDEAQIKVVTDGLELAAMQIAVVT